MGGGASLAVVDNALAFGALALLGVFGLVAANGALRRRARMKRRMAPLADLLEAGAMPVAAAPVGDTEREKTPLVALLERRYPLAGGTRTALAVAATTALGTAALVPALVFLGLPLLAGLVVGVVLSAGLGWGVGSFLEQSKRVQFNARLLMAVDDFQRLVRYGVSTAQAFKSISASAGEPAGDSLRRVVHDADLGVPLGDALGREAHRVRISELAMLAAIVSTQSRSGGGLAESVGNLADMLRERNDNRARTKAAISESKISLIILSAVPFAAVGIQAALQPDLFDTLLGNARHLLGIGAGLIATGLVIAWFMVRGTGR